MSAVYTSGLGTYLWDGVNHAQTGQAGGIAGISGSQSVHSVSDAHIDIASISPRAQLFSGLETLSRNNPAQFQKNAATIAQHLRAAATSTEDPDQADSLVRTATSFEQASQTGSFSDLFLHEAYNSSLEEPEPYAVSQIFAHVLPQVAHDVQKSNVSAAN
ncbi:MAG: hypothetical protein ACJ74Y_08985 [Bryobacteraceae bacterium]